MSESEKLIRQQICDIGKRIYDRDMVAANDGNISVRISEHEILCTPTGISKGFMTPECICKTDENGNLLEDGGGYRPSSEIKMHLKVYAARADVGAVVHAHPQFATSFAIAGQPLNQPITSEAVVLLGCVPLAPYATPSTDEVPRSIEEYLDDFDALLLENHGALTWSENLEAAYMRMESVENYARLMYRTKMIGAANVFSKQQIEKLAVVRVKTGVKGRYPHDRSGEKCYKCDKCFWRE